MTALLPSPAADSPVHRLLVQPTDQWVQQTAEKLDVLIRRMVSLTSHSHWSVRLELATFSTSLINTCWRWVLTSRRASLKV